jgi:hypothetical protein
MMTKPKSRPRHAAWGSAPNLDRTNRPPRHGLDPSTWKSLDAPRDFTDFALEVMVPIVARDNPGIAKGFHSEVLRLVARGGNERNMLVDLFSYVEEYLCSYLETHGDATTLEKIREADQYMRSMIVEV